MNEPYAIIFGILKGDNKSQKFELPIVYNEILNCYEILGAENIRPITTKYVWPTQEKDLQEVIKRAAKMESEKSKRIAERVQIAAETRRGRYVNNLNALINDYLKYDN